MEKVYRFCGIPTDEFCKTTDELYKFFTDYEIKTNELLKKIKIFLNETKIRKKTTYEKLFGFIKKFENLDLLTNFMSIIEIDESKNAKILFNSLHDLSIKFDRHPEISKMYTIYKNYCDGPTVKSKSALKKIIEDIRVCNQIQFDKLNELKEDISKTYFEYDKILDEMIIQRKGEGRVTKRLKKRAADINKLLLRKKNTNKNVMNVESVGQLEESERKFGELNDKLSESKSNVDNFIEKNKLEITVISKNISEEILLLSDEKDVIEKINEWRTKQGMLEELYKNYNELYEDILNKLKNEPNIWRRKSKRLFSIEKSILNDNSLQILKDAYLLFFMKIEKEKAKWKNVIDGIKQIKKEIDQRKTSGLLEIKKMATQCDPILTELSTLKQINIDKYISDGRLTSNVYKEYISRINKYELIYNKLIICLKQINDQRDDLLKKITDVNNLIKEIETINDQLTILIERKDNDLFQQSKNEQVKEKLKECNQKYNSILIVYKRIGFDPILGTANLHIKSIMLNGTINEVQYNAFNEDVQNIRKNYDSYVKCYNYIFYLYNTLEKMKELKKMMDTINKIVKSQQYKSIESNENPQVKEKFNGCRKMKKDIENKVKELGGINNLSINDFIINKTINEQIYTKFKTAVNNITEKYNLYIQCYEELNKMYNEKRDINALDNIIEFIENDKNDQTQLEVCKQMNIVLKSIKKVNSFNEIRMNLLNLIKSDSTDFTLRNLISISKDSDVNKNKYYNNYIFVTTDNFIHTFELIDYTKSEIENYLKPFIEKINKINLDYQTREDNKKINEKYVYDILYDLLYLLAVDLVKQLVIISIDKTDYVTSFKSAENVNKSESIKSLFGEDVSFDKILEHIQIVKVLERTSASDSVIIMGKLKPNPRKTKPSTKNTTLFNESNVFMKITWSGSVDEINENKMYNELFKLVKYNITPNILCRIFAGELNNYGILFHSNLSLNIRKDIERISGKKLNEYRDKVQLTMTNPGQQTLDEFIAVGSKEELKSVFFQLMYTLYIFQKLGIQQGDLHTGNVFIQKLETPIQLCYLINDGVEDISYRVLTDRLVKIYDFDRGCINNRTTIIKYKKKMTYIDIIQQVSCSPTEKRYGIELWGEKRDLSILLTFGLYTLSPDQIYRNLYNGCLSNSDCSKAVDKRYSRLGEFNEFIKRILPIIKKNNKYFRLLAEFASRGGLHGRPNRKIENNEIWPFLSATGNCILKDGYFKEFMVEAQNKPLDPKTDIIYTIKNKII